MKAITIFALLFNVVHASNFYTQNKPPVWRNLPSGYVEQSSCRGFICMKTLIVNGVTLEISEDGQIYREARTLIFGDKKIQQKRKLLAQGNNGHGYMSVNIPAGAKKPHKMYVHRLVAMAYIPNPNNLPIVNHKDFNPQNNHYTNLEWCTVSENVLYSLNNGNMDGMNAKPVLRFDRNGVFIQEYASLRESANFDKARSCCIGMCATGKSKTAYGDFYVFKSQYNPEIHTTEFIQKRFVK